MARHRSRSASASDARWWLILPAACSNPRAELDSRADPYAIRQWCFRLPPMCPAPSARFNATEDTARTNWSATGFSGPRTVVANSIETSAARCAIAAAASFGDGVVMCSMVTSVVFMPIPQTVESNRGKGRPGDSPCPCPDWIRRLFPLREHRGGHHGTHPRPFRGRSPVVGHRKRPPSSVTDRTVSEHRGSDSDSLEARSGPGDRSSATGSVTDPGAIENPNPSGSGRFSVSGRDSDRIHRADKGTTLRGGDFSTRTLGRNDMGGAAPEPARSSETGHVPRPRGRPRTQALRVTWFSVTPACRHVRRRSRLRSGSPPCGGVR
jgi:hypothetical protein